MAPRPGEKQQSKPAREIHPESVPIPPQHLADENFTANEKRANLCPPSPYTTPNSLQLQIYCGQRLTGKLNTINSNVQYIHTVDDCLDLCGDARPPCYAIEYHTTGRCSLLGATTDTSSFVVDQNVIVGVVTGNQLAAPLDLSCPYKNASLTTSSSGEEFEVFCNTDFAGFGDYTPYSIAEEYSSAVTDHYGVPPHADSLDECMEICSNVHPLCNGVSYNPDMTYGYGNCYLKNNPWEYPPVHADPSLAATHSARVTPKLLGAVDRSCTAGDVQTTSNGGIFEVTCGQERTGRQNITSFHEENAVSCMDHCASYSGQNCLGVVFDISMQYGFDNCYLLNGTGNADNGANATFAKRLPGSDNSHSSEAWIAGPVVGGVVVLLLVILGLFCWRRRRRRTPRVPTSNDRETRWFDLKPNRPATAPLSDGVPGMVGTGRAELSNERRRHELRDPKSEQLLQHELQG